MIGREQVYLGQHYVVVGTFDRPRRDGSIATILQWASPCAVCGETFIVTSPAGAAKFQPNRRCQRHKRPGHRVRSAP